MGILDSLRDKLLGGSADYYDEDDYYEDDEEYYDEEPAAKPAPTRQRASRQESTQQQGSGLLGNTPRPEAESVSVYTRSGRPIVQGASGTYESREEERRAEERRREALERSRAQRSYQPRQLAQTQPEITTQLPPYVLRPTAYDDVQSVIRRVRTNQPVIIILTATAIDTARRILDFCFGFSCGIDGSVEELSERIYVVLPQGASISENDIERLVADGEIQR